MSGLYQQFSTLATCWKLKKMLPDFHLRNSALAVLKGSVGQKSFNSFPDHCNVQPAILRANRLDPIKV